MARRQLDAGFWDDPDVAQLDYPERLLLICMITDVSLSDDYGVLPANAAILKKHAFGYDPCSIDQVAEWRDHILAHCRNVVLFEHNGQEYIWLKNFEKWQSIRYKRKSNLPRPPENCGNFAEKCGNPTAYSGDIPANSGKISARGEVRRGELRRDEERRGEGAARKNTGEQPAPSPTARTGRVFQTWQDLTGDLTDTDREYFADAIQEYGLEAVEYAVSEAYSHNKPAFAYVKRVLEEHARAPARASPASGDAIPYIDEFTGETVRSDNNGKPNDRAAPP